MRSQILGPPLDFAIAPTLSVAHAVEIAICIVVAQGAAVHETGFLNPSDPYLPLAVDIQQIELLRRGRAE
jgi:hypothetical protein